APGPRPLGLPRARHPRPRAPAFLHLGDDPRPVHASRADGDTRRPPLPAVPVARAAVLPDGGAGTRVVRAAVPGGGAEECARLPRSRNTLSLPRRGFITQPRVAYSRTLGTRNRTCVSTLKGLHRSGGDPLCNPFRVEIAVTAP